MTDAVLKRQRNLRGEGGRLKEEVIEAAMRLLDRAPARELSLRTVAREAGVAAPSLYKQFADANAMMKAVVWACWAQVGVEMADAADAVRGRPPLDRLEAQLGAYVRYAMQRPSRYQLLFALQLGADVDLDGPLRPAYRPVFETIEAHVADGGRLPTLDPESSAVFTLSFVHGRIALAHLAPTRSGNGPALVESTVRETIRPLFTSPGR